MALYYEDFTIGRSFETDRRAVTDAEVRAFAELSGDRNPLHLDAEAARAAGFSGPVAHGVLGLAVATGLASRLELTRGTLVALVSITWRFLAPLYPGDRVALQLRVASRKSSRPDRGVVVLSAQLRNQDDVVVQEGEFAELIRRRPAKD